MRIEHDYEQEHDRNSAIGSAPKICTITIHRSPDRLLVTMNRDEAPRWIAPADGAAGGTWIGANDRGVIACLLNRYLPGDDAATIPGRASRGRIVAAALAQGGPVETLDWLARRFDPAPYPSFTLLAVWDGETRSLSWDGGRMEEESDRSEWRAFNSSSWNTEPVIAWRAEEFARWRAAGSPFQGALPCFNLLQPEGRAEWSPLMERERSCTRSVTQAEADLARGEIAIRHWAREALAPLGEPSAARLPLRRESPSTPRPADALPLVR